MKTALTLTIEKTLPLRYIACRIAMCLGITNGTRGLAWDDNQVGPPFSHDDPNTFILDCGGNYYLKQDGNILTLTYKYADTNNEPAFAALKTWLESEFVFGR